MRIIVGAIMIAGGILGLIFFPRGFYPDIMAMTIGVVLIASWPYRGSGWLGS